MAAAGGMSQATIATGCRPAGGDRHAVCIVWSRPADDARLEVPAALVTRFLDLTYLIVPEGEEPPRTDIDDVITAILNDSGPR